MDELSENLLSLDDILAANIDASGITSDIDMDFTDVSILEENETGKESPLKETITTEESTEVNSKEQKVRKPPAEKLLQLPLARVKHIMKLDPEVQLISQDALMLVTKATEIFLSTLAKQTYNFTQKAKRKTVQRRDVDAVIDSVDALCFLEGVFD